eukprot:79090_1
MASTMLTRIVYLLLWCVFTRTLDVSAAKILHISDFHFDHNYKVGSAATCVLGSTGLGCCRKFDIGISPHRKAGEWGDPNCDSPLKLVTGIFEWMNRTFHENPELKPDFAFWTGDNPSHHDITQTHDGNLHATEVISNLFKEFLPYVQVYPCVGNHDAYPVDQLAYPPKNQWFTNMLVRNWKPWLDGPAVETLQKGGYYSILIKKGIRLVSLNTLYYDPKNLYVKMSSNKDPAEQTAWFKKTLEVARDDGEIIWIISHIPTCQLNVVGEINSLLGEYSDVIQYQFAGHTHKDETMLNRLPSNPDQVQGVQFLASAGVPSEGMSSVRFYSYDPSSFNLSDWVVYTANVTALNAAGAARVDMAPLYSAREAYEPFGLVDMSARSWGAVIRDMLTNSTLFDKYQMFKYGGRHKKHCTSADRSCWTSTVCGMWAQDKAGRATCPISN